MRSDRALYEAVEDDDWSAWLHQIDLMSGYEVREGGVLDILYSAYLADKTPGEAFDQDVGLQHISVPLKHILTRPILFAWSDVQDPGTWGRKDPSDVAGRGYLGLDLAEWSMIGVGLIVLVVACFFL